MDDRQLKKSFERIEISIAVQQRELLADTQRGNEATDRFPHRVPAAPQRPIMPRRFSRQVNAACLQHFKLQQLALHIGSRGLIPNALEHFAENEVGDSKTLALELCVEPIRLGIRHTTEVVDPDRGIDDDHGTLLRRTPESRLFEIAFPGHLTAEAAKGTLTSRPNQ
jgi:hypothetical protein